MLFDIIDLLKRYVGGLVVIDGWTLHIGSLGFRPDDESVSFTVWRLLLTLLTEAHKQRTSDWEFLSRVLIGDVQRFERQG